MEKAVKGIRKGSFVYFDPPYMPLSSSSSFTGYTLDGFNEKDQIKMKSCRLSPRLVYVDIPLIADKQGKVFSIIIWSFSTLLLLALFLYLLVA